jgi:hypothetical protein
MTVSIKTNHVPRYTVLAHELSDKEKKEFDYYSADELDSQTFFRYKGSVYCLSEFMRIAENMPEPMQSWHGYTNDTYFSGLVIHVADDTETVIIGTWFTG